MKIKVHLYFHILNTTSVGQDTSFDRAFVRVRIKDLRWSLASPAKCLQGQLKDGSVSPFGVPGKSTQVCVYQIHVQHTFLFEPVEDCMKNLYCS